MWDHTLPSAVSCLDAILPIIEIPTYVMGDKEVTVRHPEMVVARIIMA